DNGSKKHARAIYIFFAPASRKILSRPDIRRSDRLLIRVRDAPPSACETVRPSESRATAHISSAPCASRDISVSSTVPRLRRQWTYSGLESPDQDRNQSCCRIPGSADTRPLDC